ncbi:hypothetical protein FAZ19_17595 [Sphingobacterium alkalisoli]|uniref:Uncharacterized protein n=1 Tax=Sphingobacterium alkalisoli TaxID=1874115 RepID=A0A4U0GWH9_9SPHI|nr:hypothetical protein [Sphingobacterium alkalisoli]TJY63398.1 hypothetical protein FAZ19_17595 [Sphingobacterium alkalisoli]GGH25809.1 hypothetical protein GCM10011418_34640 [Sphingobacterium alkalisoli]
MENTAIERQPKKTDNNANQTGYYVSLTIAIIIGLFGVFVRFVPDVIPSLGQSTFIFSLIANLAVLLASFLAFKVVFAILGFGSKKE